MKYEPHGYQRYAERRILDQEAVGLFLDMGMGKTVVTLTAVDELMYNRFEIARVLVIAPYRVADDTWTREAEKWDHLRHLKVARVLGTEKQRLAALRSGADIFVINRENTDWLVKQYGKKSALGIWPFDMVVVDELSSFKSASSQRFKALRKVRPLVTRFVGLTGTPAPKGYIDLWAQVYLLDSGQRLGRTITAYREHYFHAGRMDHRRNIVYQWELDDGAKEQIDAALRDLCVSMRAEDYLDLPERIDVTRPVVFTEAQRKQYKRLERDYLLTVDESTITGGTAAAVTNKLQQFAQGAAYTTDIEHPDAHGEWIALHDAKLEALDEIIEAANGKPVLVFYWFKHDLARLQARHPEARILDTRQDIEDWNAQRIPLLLAQPSGTGHGLNIQEGGNIIVWFALTWDLEIYQQANRRLLRPGQREECVIFQHLVAEGTVDEDIMKALQGKAEGQNSLLEALKARKEAAIGA